MELYVNLSDEDAAMLDRLAEQLGLPHEQALVEAMRRVELKSIKTLRLAEAMDYVLTHDRELLDKLSDS